MLLHLRQLGKSDHAFEKEKPHVGVVQQCLRIHASVYGNIWKNFAHVLCVKVNPSPEIDSCPALKSHNFCALAGVFNAADNLGGRLCETLEEGSLHVARM